MTRSPKLSSAVYALGLALLLNYCGGGHSSVSVVPPANRYWQVGGVNASWHLCYDNLSAGVTCLDGQGNQNFDAPDGIRICATLTKTGGAGFPTVTCMPVAIIFGPLVGIGDQVSGCCGP